MNWYSVHLCYGFLQLVPRLLKLLSCKSVVDMISTTVAVIKVPLFLFPRRSRPPQDWAISQFYVRVFGISTLEQTISVKTKVQGPPMWGWVSEKTENSFTSILNIFSHTDWTFSSDILNSLISRTSSLVLRWAWENTGNKERRKSMSSSRLSGPGRYFSQMIGD